MTKVLIVDDEPALARSLMRAILHRRPDYAVLTAGGGSEAVSLLEEQHIDLVVTDLKMSDMDGFALIAWLNNQRPHVFALAMTGYADEDTERRLRSLGGIEFFRKPVDVDSLIGGIDERLARTMRGEVHNVSLASFVQLLELERKTCTLEVRTADQVGKLYLQLGQVIAATTGLLTGEEAACTIIGWPQVSITIESECSVHERAIDKPAYYLVMEAMRLRDERGRATSVDDEEGALSAWMPDISAEPAAPSAPAIRERLDADAFHRPMGTLLLAVVDTETGVVLLGPDQASAETAALVGDALLMLNQQRAIGASTHDELEEVVILGARRGELIKPLSKHNCFALLVFDLDKTNLGIARLELEKLALQYMSCT